VKVLVVEDDIQVRDYISMLLEAGHDCEILEASSGNEAITILQFDPEVDLLITEVKMKGGDGHVIVDYLDELKLYPTIVWLSHLENKDIMIVQEVLARNEFNAFVAKPFKDVEFFPVIEEILSRRQVETTLAEQGRRETSSNHSEISSDLKSINEKVEEAGYSLKKKSKNHVEGEAGYSLKMESKDHAEGEAGYSLKVESKDHGEGEAGYSLKVESKDHAEGEAGYSLKMESKDHAEGEAGYSLKVESKDHAEGEADYSLKKESENHEEEAFYALKKMSSSDSASRGLGEVNKSEPVIQQMDYQEIRIKRFLNFTSLCCDAFIKIGESKFIKILEKDISYDKEQIEKYQKKEVEYLFIKKADYEGFCHHFSDLVSDRLEVAKGYSDEIQAVSQLAAFESTRNLAKEFGVTEKAAKKVKQSVQATLNSIAKKPDLSAILKRILRGGDYISERSLLVSYFAGQICMNTSWSSPATLEKLSMAALFHDIGLEENRLARVSHLNEAKDLSKEETLVIKQHPGLAAQLVSQGESIFSDVESIILQHHEKPDQSGFPRGLGALSISPLSCIFILASEFAYEVYGKQSAQVDKELIKERFKEKYNSGNFKKPLQAFLSSF